jgi:WD40 repeat protein
MKKQIVLGVSGFIILFLWGIGFSSPSHAARLSWLITPTALPPVNPTPLGSPIAVGRPLATATPAPKTITPANISQLTEVAQMRLEEPTNAGVSSLAFARDGRHLAAVWDTVRVWQMPERKLVQALPLSSSSWTPAAISPDGKIIAIGNHANIGWVELWDLATGQRVRQHQGGQQVRALSFSMDGAFLVAGREYGGSIWDTASGGLLQEISACGGAVFHPSRAEVSASQAASMGIWSPQSNQPVRTLTLPEGLTPYCDAKPIAYAPDGITLALGSFGGRTIALWRDEVYAGALSHPKGGQVWQMAWSPDSRMLAVVEVNAGSEGAQLVFWDVKQRQVAAIWDHHAGAVAFSPDGSSVVVSGIVNQAVVLRILALPS